MCIDIYDTTVPDYRIIESAEIMQIFCLRKRGEVSEAVSAFKLPMPLDYCGFNGSARWSVGQIRQWIMWKGSVQNELSKQNFVSAWKNGALPGPRRGSAQAEGNIETAVEAIR